MLDSDRGGAETIETFQGCTENRLKQTLFSLDPCIERSTHHKDSEMEHAATLHSTTGFAVFDADHLLLEANQALLGIGEDSIDELAGKPVETVLKPVIQAFRQFDGRPVKRTKAFLATAIEAWSQPESAPIEVEAADGSWRLLTSHPRPGGGTALIAMDVTGFKQSQLTLQANEEVFRCITESHPLPVWMADEETGEILYESDAASEILGRPWDPDTPQYITDHYVDPKDREKVKQLMRSRDALRDHEVELKTAEGERFWISSNVRRGTFHGRSALIAGILDITARKEREDQLRYLMESHPMPVWANDSETGEILYTSEAANRLFGAAPGGDRTFRVGDFFDDPERNAAALAQLRKEGFLENYDISARSADGKKMWVTGAARIVEYGGREIVLAGIMDITSRKQREEQVRFILEGHPLPMWMNDAETGALLFESPATARMFGREWSSEPNVSIHDHYVDLDDRKSLVKRLETEGEVEGYECNWQKADGTQFWARGNVRLMEYQGRPVVLAGILDVTEQKHRELELAEARELLSDAIESLSEGFALYDEHRELIMCNTRYKEMNKAAVDILVPGVKWIDVLRYAAERGEYEDAKGRIEEWLQERSDAARTFIGSHEMQHTNGRWYSITSSPTRQGGFVITRAEITERKQVEQSRREADEVIRQVVDACPVALEMQRLSDGGFIFKSSAAVDMLGERVDARASCVTPAEADNLLAELQESGDVVDRRMQLRHGDGTPFWGSVSARTAKFRGQDVIVSTIQDLTERVAIEEERNRAAKRLIDAVSSLAEGFALFDADEKLVMCNERYREYNAQIADLIEPGVSYGDLVIASAERQQYEGSAGREAQWIAEYNTAEAGRQHHYELRQSDGKWFSSARSPTTEGGFVITRIDISERKAAEAEERQGDALVRQVLEACPVMIMMNHVDDGRVVYRSPATQTLFGKPESVVSFYAEPADRDVYIERMKRDGYVDEFEYDARRPNGEIFPAAVSGRLIDYQGESVIVSHTVDLTERYAIERELARQKDILHQSEKLSALGGLLAGVAHELNNPLSVVVGQSLLLKETATDKNTVQRAEKIGKAADRCARIVKTFLDMARQQPARTENFAVNGVLESALDIAGYAIRSSNIAVTLCLTNDLPMVWGDRDQLAQVFTNLLVNAENALSEYPGDRRIKIASRYDDAAAQIIVKIEDNGPGIPEEIRSRVFEPFFTTKEVGSGTGIGLAFCHRIIETHGGTLTVTSKPKVSTAFFLRLPISDHVEPATAEVQSEAADSGDGLEILVIDDEPDVADLIAEILINEGHAVTIAQSGARGLSLVEEGDYALILSDLNMPELNGSELFDRLSISNPELVERLAFITGDTMSPRAREFLGESGRPYLEKPIRPEELRNLVTGMRQSG
jgi:PAS domain S-box-containing protein